MHPPWTETCDVGAGTTIDRHGSVCPVEEYRVEPYGLYLCREVCHPKMTRLESWLLPELGLRVTDFWLHPGHHRDQDFYVDVADIDRSDGVWRVTDHYLDIVTGTGRFSRVIDLDEFVAAVGAGLLDAATAERALAVSYRAVAGLAAHHHDLSAWTAGLGMPLTWRRR